MAELLKKISEETIVVIIASTGEYRERAIRELADLELHCMALRPEARMSHNDVLSELEIRLNTKENPHE